MMPHALHRLSTITLILMIALGAMGADGGCADISPEPGAGRQGKPPAYDDQDILDAEDALRAHQPGEALKRYDLIVREGDTSSRGTAAAGRAIVTLMLLPDDPAMQRLLIDHLGATRVEYDTERLIWANNGILYWLARGTSWEDNGQLQGIRSLVSDQLPWETRRLSSPDAFLAGLDSTGSDALDALLPITKTLQSVEDDLARAMSDAAFERFYIPAEVFHNKDMGLVLGRAELSLLRGVVALTRGALLFIAAYEHGWTLSHLSQGYWTGVLNDAQHPEHRAELTSAEDYLYTYLDDKLLRRFRDASRLAEARRAGQRGLEAMASALELGSERGAAGSTLQWQRGDQEVNDLLIRLVRAVSASMDKPTLLPNTRPAATLDLSVLFGDGRLLPASTPLFTRAEDTYEDETGQPITQFYWDNNPEAQDALLKGVLSPDGAIELDIRDGALDGFQRAVVGELEDNVNDAYLGSL